MREELWRLLEWPGVLNFLLPVIMWAAWMLWIAACWYKPV